MNVSIMHEYGILCNRNYEKSLPPYKIKNARTIKINSHYKNAYLHAEAYPKKRCDIIKSHNKSVNIVHRQSFIIKIWHFTALAIQVFFHILLAEYLTPLESMQSLFYLMLQKNMDIFPSKYLKYSIYIVHILSVTTFVAFFFFNNYIYIPPKNNNIIICILQGLPYLIIRKACMSVPLFRENVCHDQNMKKSFVHYDH